MPIATLVSTDRPVAVQGTLDDIAEEMLNGLFCHYEPPTKKKKHRGILRAPKMFRRNDSNLTTVSEATSASKKGVRWSQRVEAAYPKPQSTEVHCNVIQTVVDGCAEVGLVKSPTKAKEALAKYDLTELEKKHAMSAAKKAEEADYKKRKESMRRAMEEDSSDSDDSGITHSKVRPPPPPPPPPPRNCGLIADICGAVHMECGDAKDTCTPRESEVETRQEVHRGEHHRRPKQPFDYMDGVVEKPRDHMITSVPSGESVSSVKSASSRFSTLKRIWPRKRDGKSGRITDGYESDPETKGRGRRHSRCAATKEDVDPIIMSKRGKSFTGEDEDWDQSLSIFPNKKEKSKQSSWLPKVSQSKNERRASSPGPLRNLSNNTSERRNSLVGIESGDKRTRSQSPGLRQGFDRNLHATTSFVGSSFQNPSVIGSAVDDSFERQSMITAYRAAFDPASEANFNPLDDSCDRQSFITAYRQGFGEDPANDDMFDRQSFITASRQGNSYANSPRDWVAPTSFGGNPSAKQKSPQKERFRFRRSQSPSRRSRSQSPGRRASNGQQRFDPRSQNFGNQQPLSELPFYSNQNVNGQNQHLYKTGAPVYQQFPPYIPGEMPPMYYPGFPDSKLSQQPQFVSHQLGENQQQQQISENKKSEDLSWEERTRQAWERLRGGTTSIAEQLASSLMMTQPEHNKDTDEGTHAPDQKAEEWIGQHAATHPVGILKKPSQEKKVTFGPPQEQQYYNDLQDENMSIYEAPSHEGRKRYKFRGTKILTEMFSKRKKNHPEGKKNAVRLGQSRSADMTASMSASMSRSWGEDGSAPHHHPPHSYYPPTYHLPQHHPGYQTGYYHQQQPGSYPSHPYMSRQPVPGQSLGYYYPTNQGKMPTPNQPRPSSYYGPQNGIYNKQPTSFHQSPVRAVIQ